jgi:hypothetical protein
MGGLSASTAFSSAIVWLINCAEQALIHLGMAFIFGEIALVVAFAEDSDRCRVDTVDRVHKRLKNRKSIFRSVALQPQGSEGETVRSPIGQIETTLWGKVFILRVGKALPGAADHSVELGACRWLPLELAHLNERFKFFPAHVSGRLPIQ